MLQVPLRQYFMLIATLLSVVLATTLSDLASWLRQQRSECFAARLLAVLAVVMLAQPAVGLAAERRRRNDEQLAVLEYVWENTAADDAVFDCWTGLYVFRPHAFFYHFLGPDVVAALDRLDPRILRVDLLQALLRKKPRVVIFDSQCDLLPAAVRGHIGGHYRAGKYPFILFRRSDA